MDKTPEPLTEDVLAELLASPSLYSFDSAHDGIDCNLSHYLSQLLDEKHLRKADVIHDAQLNETFGYQIFSGSRNPTRNKVLQLAFSMRCTVRETQRLLHHAHAASLYPKNRRDAIMLYCLDNNATLQQTEAVLYEFGEATLGSAEA